MHEIKKEVWLDLEETVINNWFDNYFLHKKAKKIKAYLDSFEKEIKTLNIWSYAIWHEEDKGYFEDNIKQPLEEFFERPIIQYPSIEAVQKLIQEEENFRYQDLREYVQINGKWLGFIKYARLFTDREMYLIDDSVPHSIIQFPEIRIKLITLNIDNDF